jgi:hypothetical protein
MTHLALRAAAVLALGALVGPPIAHAQQVDEVTVPVSGEAAIRGDSVLAASHAARLAAYREGLRMQLFRLLDSLGAEEAYPRLQSRARVYVRREEVEDEERAGDVMRVAMRLVMDVARLRADLEALGYEVLTIGTDLPSVMVVVDEFYVHTPRAPEAQAADAPPPSALAGRAQPATIPDSLVEPYTRAEYHQAGSRVSAGALEEALNRHQFTVLDPSTVAQLRADMPALTGELIKQGDLLAEFTRRANERFHAQLVLIAAATVLNAGKDANGLDIRRSLMTYRALDASTGRVLATGSMESAALAPDPLVARQRALSRISELAAERVIPQLTRAWRDRAARGELYIVELVGFQGFAAARAFLGAVQGIEGVTQARQTQLDIPGRRLRIEVTFTRPREELMSEIFEEGRKLPGFATLDLRNQRGNEMIFAVQ